MTRIIPIKYRIIITMLILFFIVSGFIFFIRKNSLEKNVIFSHAQMHIEMPMQAISMEMHLHQIVMPMEESVEDIEDQYLADKNRDRYNISLVQFRDSQKKFEKLVSAHNSKWTYSQAQLDQNPEHKTKHSRNKEIFNEIVGDIEPFFALSEEFFIHIDNKENEKAISFFREIIEPESYKLEMLLNEFVDLQEWEADFHLAGLQAAQANIDNLIWTLFISLFFIILVFIYFLVVFSLQPIKSMSSSIDRIIKGDSSHRINIKTKDELGVMASKFNQMMDEMLSAQERLKKTNLELSEEKRKATSKEKMFKDLAEQSPDCIKVFDKEGKIIYMSPGGLKEHGFKKEEEAIGWDFTKSIVKRQREDVTEMLQDCLSEGKEASMEVEHVRKYADRDWCDLSIGPIKGADNKIIGALAVSRDITDLKKNISVLKQEVDEGDRLKRAMINLLEDVEDEKNKNLNEKNRMDRILHSIGDGVVVIDNLYRIILFNEQASLISGFNFKEAIGRKYSDILRFMSAEDGVPQTEFVKESMQSGEVKRMPANTILVKKDGEKIAVGDSAAPIKNQSGRVIGCVIVFRDTTREREIDTAKNEFVSLASHQLRTPLTAINWYLEMLSSGDAGKINNEQKKYIKEIYNGSKRMVALVNALLNTSRIDLGTFAIEPELVDFKDIAESILLELAPDVTRKKMKIEKYYDKNLPKIKADPKLIRIIFQNLLSNAVKYTQEGGKIELKIDKDKKNINIEVSDNGYGIPAKQQEKIFSKLFRADNAREKETDGTGLGLYIIKSILEKTDGKIWFKSKENKGTSFYVTIPLIGMKRKEGIKGLS